MHLLLSNFIQLKWLLFEGINRCIYVLKSSPGPSWSQISGDMRNHAHLKFRYRAVVSLSFFQPMSVTENLQEADKASRIALSFFDVATLKDIDNDSLWHSCDDVENSINQLGRGSDYLDYDTVCTSIQKEGNSDTDWVRPVVDRLNLSVFTNAVWSDTQRYDEAIDAYFSLVVPKQLHDRDDVIDMFLNMVMRRQIIKAPWPTDQHEIQGVVNTMKERIEDDLEYEEQWLCQRVLDAFNKKYEHVDTMPKEDLDYMAQPQRLKEAWFELLPTMLDSIENKVDHQQAKGSGSGNATESGDDDNGSNAENEDGQEDDFYDASTHFGNDGDREGNRVESEDEVDELEDDDGTPDEPHTGTKRAHNEEDDDDVGPFDKRIRPEPIVVSALSVDEQSQGSHRSHEDENNDTSGAWGEENNHRDGTPVSGDYCPPAPPYARRSTSHSLSESDPHLHGNASPTSVDSEPLFITEDASDARQHRDNRMENGSASSTFVDSEPLFITEDASDARHHSNDRMEDGNASSQSQRLPHGLQNTINLGPSSPIPFSDDEQPTSSNVAYHARRIGERGDIAKGRPARGRNPLLMSNISNAQQQDDQGNDQSSTSVTTAPPIQQRRRHHRRELPDNERYNATAPVPQQQNGDRLRKLNEYWTDEEVAALDQGLREYSRRWVAIKARFPDILRNRTNVQLKDKARNIARQRRKDGLPLEHYEGCG
ncbi:predicted protein [Lichtheimia corymbifera JMRC:FSU:9682]|uniref:Myb-like domain-containing protein n=1 Tax=Lichtheimia corymbifera JMRC:FSU:9682 TaxID=1263082 RepID=A0A068SBY2_9FUNG|nr:predicted protein [Lichtheimia corymbifera JMRC:FSU:9682]